MNGAGLFDLEERGALQEAMFEAYYACRKNKRNTRSALAFELDFERRIFALADAVFDGTWHPLPSTAFVVQRPVKREVFAAAFSDRVVHHWLMAKLNPHFEQLFIEDSYACRMGKGTHYGVTRLQHHIQQSGSLHPRGAFALKLDIRGFFMSIPREQLWRRLEPFIRSRYREMDLGTVLKVAERIVKLDATQGCRVAGRPSDWDGLPADKSLFRTARGRGLPIGNLTSQVLANFYLHPLDEFITRTLGFPHYGRYVDDFYLIDNSPHKLRLAIPSIQRFLQEELSLQLHPRKVVLQHVRKGVAYLGAVVWPEHITAGKRLRANFYALAREIQAQPQIDALEARQRVNSYLGLMGHYKTFRLRRKILNVMLEGHGPGRLHFDPGLRKVVIPAGIGYPLLNLRMQIVGGVRQTILAKTIQDIQF
jgi:RNA-directed DNA polymerase